MSKNFDTDIELVAASREVAAAAVASVRRAAAGDEVSKTELARRLGMGRQTISSHFGKGDMSLSEFIAASLALGRRPSDLLADAEGSAPALAGPDPVEAGVES